MPAPPAVLYRAAARPTPTRPRSSRWSPIFAKIVAQARWALGIAARVQTRFGGKWQAWRMPPQVACGRMRRVQRCLPGWQQSQIQLAGCWVQIPHAACVPAGMPMAMQITLHYLAFQQKLANPDNGEVRTVALPSASHSLLPPVQLQAGSVLGFCQSQVGRQARALCLAVCAAASSIIQLPFSKLPTPTPLSSVAGGHPLPPGGVPPSGEHHCGHRHLPSLRWVLPAWCWLIAVVLSAGCTLPASVGQQQACQQTALLPGA